MGPARTHTFEGLRLQTQNGILIEEFRSENRILGYAIVEIWACMQHLAILLFGV